MCARRSARSVSTFADRVKLRRIARRVDVCLPQHRPRPEGESETHIRVCKRIQRGTDVEHRKALNILGMIELHSIRDSGAAGVAGNGGTFEASAHRSSVAPCPLPSRVSNREVLRVRGRCPAGAVAAQIRAYHEELLGEGRRYPMPHWIGLGKAVQKQQRPTATFAPHEYGSSLHLKMRRSKLRRHEAVYPHWRGRNLAAVRMFPVRAAVGLL